MNNIIDDIDSAYDSGYYEGYERATREFADRLMDCYIGENIADDMHCPIGVIKQNIYDVKKRMIGED